MDPQFSMAEQLSGKIVLGTTKRKKTAPPKHFNNLKHILKTVYSLNDKF